MSYDNGRMLLSREGERLNLVGRVSPPAIPMSIGMAMAGRHTRQNSVAYGNATFVGRVSIPAKNKFDMPNYRRYYIPNSIYFITSVTKERRQLFKNDENIELLFETMNNVKAIKPFKLLAFCFLPDHFHCLIGEIRQGANITSIAHSIKRNFTLNYKKKCGKNNELNLWQKRFWDHTIRDEQDLQNHLDYIHFNP